MPHESVDAHFFKNMQVVHSPARAHNNGGQGVVHNSDGQGGFFAQKLVSMGGLSWVGGYVSGAALLSLIAVLCLNLNISLFETAKQALDLFLSSSKVIPQPDALFRDDWQERINTLQQQLAYYEQIKRITLLPHHFSMESGELTNTLKIRRPIINKNYQEEIDKNYEE